MARAKFKAAGLSDVRIQPLDLEPLWMPQTWDVVVTGGGKTVRLDSAQPFYGTRVGSCEGIPAAVTTVCQREESGYNHIRWEAKHPKNISETILPCRVTTLL